MRGQERLMMETIVPASLKVNSAISAGA